MSASSQDASALRAEVEAEGRARVEAIRRAADERIARLHAHDDAAAAQRRDEALRRQRGRARATRARALARARSEGQRRVLEARDALLERVFAHARERLATALEGPAARERLVERAREALAFVPKGGVVIHCSTGLAAVLERELAAQLEEDADLRIETDPELPAGFRVSAAAGSLLVDGTLESLLEQQRPVLAIEVLRQLGTEAP